MKFLVAVDGSDASHRALDYARELAEAADASLTIVHSVDPTVYAESSPEPVSDLAEADRLYVAERVEESERRGAEILDGARGRVTDGGVDVSTSLLYGDPVVAVSDFAEENGFDAIIVGHHGVSARTEAAFGSVAKGLVSRARVPVTVVR